MRRFFGILKEGRGDGLTFASGVAGRDEAVRHEYSLFGSTPRSRDQWEG